MIDHLLYNDEVEAAELLELAIKAFVVNESAELSGALLKAYCIQYDEEDDAKPKGWAPSTDEEHRERYAFFVRHYKAAYRHLCDEVCEPDWPEGFTPQDFVLRVARIEGQKDRAGLRMMQQLHEEMDQDERTLNREQFKSKHGFYPAL